MKAGEIYDAPSGTKYKAVKDTVKMMEDDTFCNYCDCKGKRYDCIKAPCWDNVHFELLILDLC